MTPLSILVTVGIWVLGQARGSWSAHGVLRVFFAWIVAKLLCSCLCLFDVINELRVMDEKMFNYFLIRK